MLNSKFFVTSPLTKRKKEDGTGKILGIGTLYHWQDKGKRGGNVKLWKYHRNINLRVFYVCINII